MCNNGRQAEYRCGTLNSKATKIAVRNAAPKIYFWMFLFSEPSAETSHHAYSKPHCFTLFPAVNCFYIFVLHCTVRQYCQSTAHSKLPKFQSACYNFYIYFVILWREHTALHTRLELEWKQAARTQRSQLSSVLEAKTSHLADHHFSYKFNQSKRVNAISQTL